MKRSYLTLAGSLAALLIGAGQVGASVVVDQSNTVSPVNRSFIPSSSSSSIGTNGPLGQEFTPTAATAGLLNFVDLAFHNQTNSAEAMTVNIRLADASHDLNGALLGSASLVVPALFDSANASQQLVQLLRFNFASDIHVTPGTKYAIEVVDSGATPGGVVSYANAPATYAGGTMIVSNAAFAGASLTFQEGAAVPEPGTLMLSGFSAVFMAGYALRRRRKQAAEA